MFEISIITDYISRDTLLEMTKDYYGDLVKAVVDIKRAIMAVGGELHADEEKKLIDDGSRQEDLWGINFYPHEQGDDWIEFDSMINIRPARGNRSRGVEDENIQKEIRRIVLQLTIDTSQLP